MVCEIFANPEFINRAVLEHFVEHVCVEVVKVVTQIVRRNIWRRETLGCRGGANLVRGLVKVVQEESLAEQRLVVDA